MTSETASAELLPQAVRGPLSVSASIVSAQLLTLREELERLREAGVDSVHLDIEDGNFVPVMNLGTRIVECVVEWGGLPAEVHLMVSDPEEVLRMLDGLELHSIAFHAESTQYPRRVLRIIKESGRRAGLALNPASPIPELGILAPYLDFVIVLTTEPEEGSTAFLADRLAAVTEIVAAGQAHGVSVIVDGAVDASTADAVAAAGATGVVVGRALFSSADLPATVRTIKKGSVS